MEILLALGLLLVLMTVFALSMRSLNKGVAFDEGLDRLETTLIRAKLESSQTGKRIRIAFWPTTGELVLFQESQPLTQPGVFSEYPCSWKQSISPGMFKIVSSQLSGSSVYADAWSTDGAAGASGGTSTATVSGGGGSSDSAGALGAITFYPNGSCDSATLELVPADEEDLRRAIVAIDGLGVVSVQKLTPTEYQQYVQDSSSTGAQ